MTVDRFAEVLNRAQLELQPRELAEAIWLARLLPVEQSPRTVPAPPEPPPAAVAAPLPEPEAVSKARPSARDRVELRGQGTGEGQEGRFVQVPAAPMLGRVLPLQRALRPLKRRIPSARRDLLDEEATAVQIADSGRWVPVLTFTPERWLDLVLVVDTGPSMWPWRPLVRELRAMLTQLGAFRDVRVSYLDDGRISPGPAALIDPSERRLVLVLSDCSGRHWWDGRAQRVLAVLARRNLTTILQPLPEQMWRRTAAPTVPGFATAKQPCAPNPRLAFEPFDGHPVPAGIPVPVLELDPLWFTDWARLVAGESRDGIATAMTFVRARHEARTSRPREELALGATDRVLRFQASATPEAVRLAAFIAVSTPTLPVMRLVQRSMLPGSAPSHLAEVVVSGLLRPRERDAYEFVSEEVRQAVQKLVPRSEAWLAIDVLKRVSSLIERRAPTSGDTFSALSPGEGGGAGAEAQPFALVNPNAIGLLSDLGLPPRTVQVTLRATLPRVGTGSLGSAKRRADVGAAQEIGPGQPYFFLSCPDREAQMTGFFSDLCAEISSLTGVDAAEVGYTGERHRAQLGQCRVLVPLYSPDYFASESCGQELAAFFARDPPGRQTSAVVPALWTRVPTADLPEVLRGIEWWHPDMGSNYPKLGFSGLQKMSRQRGQYNRALRALAARIVAVAETSPMPVGDVSGYASLPSAFASADRVVTFGIIAPAIPDLPHGREVDRFYGRSAMDWDPFRGTPGPHSLRLRVAEMAGGRVRFLSNTRTQLRGVQEPFVLLLDPWALLDKRLWSELRESGLLRQPGFTVVAVWNEADAETINRERALRGRLSMLRAAEIKEVRSLAELRDLIPVLLAAPAASGSQLNAFCSLIDRGDERVQAGDLSGAAAAYEAGGDVLAGVIENGPRSAAVLWNMSVLHERFADLLHPTPAAGDEYLKSLEIRRGLMHCHPAQLAMVLNKYAIWLAEAGRSAEALPARDEVVAICRTLVARDRSTYLPALAIALDNLAGHLGEQEHQAFPLIEEVAEITRELPGGWLVRGPILPLPASRPVGNVPDRGPDESSSAYLARLLTIRNVHLVVDGSNVVSRAPRTSSAAQPEAMQRLLSRLGSLSPEVEVTCVFDPPEHVFRVPAPAGVRVLFGGHGDELVRDLVWAEPAGRLVVVVTDDRMLADSISGAGVRVPVSALFEDPS